MMSGDMYDEGVYSGEFDTFEYPRATITMDNIMKKVIRVIMGRSGLRGL